MPGVENALILFLAATALVAVVASFFGGSK